MTAAEVFANQPSTTVTSGGGDVPAPGTAETWTVASSATFPAASSSASPPSQFHVSDPAAPSEIMAVTNVSGTTWTVTRGAESSTPVAHSGAFTVVQVVTAGVLSSLTQPYGRLTRTAVRTGAYTAAPGDYVVCDSTSGTFAVALPHAPADGSAFGVKIIASASPVNAVTITTSGGDVFNKAGGATTETLSLLNQGIAVQYQASTGIYTIYGDDLALSQLDARYFPKSQTVTTVSNSFADLYSVATTGSTDTVGPFELAQGGRTVSGVLAPVWYLGYNALQGASGSAGSNGAAAINFWADAGDTSSSGAHGVEINLSWFGPAGTTSTGAFQFVAVNDDTNTVHTVVRCGTGTSGPYPSQITFQNGDASKTFTVMDNAGNGSVTHLVPNFIVSNTQSSQFTVTTNAASSNNNLTFSALGSSSQTIINLIGNRGNGVANSSLIFNSGGNQWIFQHLPPNFVITDAVNSRTAVSIKPGSTPAAALFQVNSVLQGLSSVICGNAALATTATTGFLYLPTCSGTPTGTPVTETGTCALVFDTSANKLWVYDAGWIGVALA